MRFMKRHGKLGAEGDSKAAWQCLRYRAGAAPQHPTKKSKVGLVVVTGFS